MNQPKGPPAPLPLTILTGFLGAGKTTLLNHLLRDPAMAETLVLINEFGEIGLDHLLVEHVEDGLVLLSAGCLCCTIRGDLVSTLEDLLRKRDNGRIEPFRRIMIETTGLADPAPVLAAVLYHPYLSRRYAVEGVVTVVDGVNGAETLDRHEEARRQVAVADRLVLTKLDLASDETARATRDAIRRLNPRAPLLVAEEGRVPAGDLLAGGLFTAEGKIGDVAAWLRAEESPPHDHGHDHGHDHHHHDDHGPHGHGHHGHGHGLGHGHGHGHANGHGHDVSRHQERIRSFVLTADRPVSRSSLDMFLEMARGAFGPKILRLKGLIDLVEEPGRPLVIHGVQHVLHVPALLPAWPDADRRSRIVIIAEDVPEESVRRMWNAFSGQAGIDAPDGVALSDNPLAPATLGRRV